MEKSTNSCFVKGLLFSLLAVLFPIASNGSTSSVSAIDLGLPSGTKWADMNIDANSISDYGNFYSWGEVETKTDYSFGNYNYGSVLDIAGSDMDVAYVTLGENWSMPTKAQWVELQNQCTWEWSSVDDVEGYMVTGPNGQSIFIPAAGSIIESTHDGEGYYGYYWSTTQFSSYYGWAIYMTRQSVNWDGNGGYKCDGRSVRAVYTGEDSGNNAVSQMQVKTIMVDANSQPPVVAAMVSAYSKVDVVEKGFIVGENEGEMNANAVTAIFNNCEIPNNYEYDYPVSGTVIYDCTHINLEQFNMRLKYLYGNKDYFVRAYIKTRDGEYIYGEICPFHTQDFNRSSNKVDYANVWDAFSNTLFDLITDEIIDPDIDGFFYSTNESPSRCNYQYGTSYNTCYKYMTEWNYRLWYWNRSRNTCKPDLWCPVMSYKDNMLTITPEESTLDKSPVIYYKIDGQWSHPEEYTDIYDGPIWIEKDCVVYCYAEFSDGSISYQNMYIVDQDFHENNQDTIIDYNIFEIQDVSASSGDEVVIPVVMKNCDTITAFQTDIVLPLGLTIAEDEDGELLIYSGNRDSDHTLSYSQQADGTLRVVGFSTTLAPYASNDGVLFYFVFKVDKTMSDGEYVINLKNTRLSTVDGKEILLPSHQTIVTISNYALGDVDNNGSITITDAVKIINYILGTIEGTFITEAADINQNGEISVVDAVLLINQFILGADDLPSQQLRAQSRGVYDISDAITLSLKAVDQEKETIDIAFQLNPGWSITALQADAFLPKGPSFDFGDDSAFKMSERIDDHICLSREQANGAIRMVLFSPSASPFADVDSELFSIRLAAGGFEKGEYDLIVSNIELTDIEGNPIRHAPIQLTFNTNTSSVSVKVLDQIDENIYDLSGRKLEGNSLPTGFYIINGQKIFVK